MWAPLLTGAIVGKVLHHRLSFPHLERGRDQHLLHGSLRAPGAPVKGACCCGGGGVPCSEVGAVR